MSTGVPAAAIAAAGTVLATSWPALLVLVTHSLKTECTDRSLSAGAAAGGAAGAAAGGAGAAAGGGGAGAGAGAAGLQ